MTELPQTENSKITDRDALTMEDHLDKICTLVKFSALNNTPITPDAYAVYDSIKAIKEIIHGGANPARMG